MTQSTDKTEPRWAELSDEVLASVEAGRTTAIEAVHKFADEIAPVLADRSRASVSGIRTPDDYGQNRDKNIGR